MMMTRPQFNRFDWDGRRGLYRFVSHAGYSWYLIEPGLIEPGLIEPGLFEQGKDRPIIWAREEGETYLVCPICRAINKIDTVHMFINDRDLDSPECVICSSCKSHFWCSLIGWVEKASREFMRRNPGVCPLCNRRDYVTSDIVTLISFENPGCQERMDLCYCNDCRYFWPSEA
jgi:Zn ribbon nucleic-acid-binding protein